MHLYAADPTGTSTSIKGSNPLKIYQPARFIRRYKRFLADVELNGGKLITVHCPNTGAMRHCLEPGTDCWLSESNNPARKYKYTLEFVTTHSGAIACINSAYANTLAAKALASGAIDSFGSISNVRREITVGEDKRRLDFLLSTNSQDVFMEVKSVTLEEEAGKGFFPDAQSVRARQHLVELMKLREVGHRAALLFCVQHTAIRSVAPAANIDPEYARLCSEAKKAGVEFYAYKMTLAWAGRAIVGVAIEDQLPVHIA